MQKQVLNIVHVIPLLVIFRGKYKTAKIFHSSLSNEKIN